MTPDEITSLETRLKVIGFLICVVVPVALLVVIWTVLAPGDANQLPNTDDMELFVWILSAMAFAEPVIGFVMRKRLLSVDALINRSSQGGVSQGIFAGHLVGYAFAVSPAVFGMVVYLVTHNAVLATVMICFSPLAYLFFRPTEATVRELAQAADAKLAARR